MAEAHLKPKLIFWRCLDLMVRERVQGVAIGPAPYHSIIKPGISANLAELGE